MRSAVAIGLLSSLFLYGCSKERFSSTHISKRTEASTTVDFSLSPKDMSLSLPSPITASIKEVDILCDAKRTLLSYNLTPSNQTITMARSLTGCEFILKSFHLAGLENRPIANPIYTYTQASGTTKDGVIYSVFDLKNDQGQVLDRKLVSSSIKEETSTTCPTANCFLTRTTVSFNYSEIKRSDVILENNLRIQELMFQISQETAPKCSLGAQFVHPAGQNPYLQFTLKDCTELLAHKDIAIGIAHHRYSNVYQALTQAQDPTNFVGLHNIIDGYNLTANMNSGSLTINLTLEQLMQITGKTTWIGAIREDFVVALRNRTGKSVSYFIVDNTCTSDIVDRFQDIIAKVGNASWSLGFPGPANRSYYTINGLVLDPSKPAEPRPGFCIDSDRSNELNFKYEGKIFLSYDLDRLYQEKIVERPAAMPAVNWMINKYIGTTTYTYGELQKAVWHLLDDQVISNGLGPVDDNKVAALVQEARRDGMTYVPTKVGDYVAVVLVPYIRENIENQSLISIAQIPADLCTPSSAGICK